MTHKAMLILSCFLFCSAVASAQVSLPDDAKALMEDMQLDYLEPVESFYKSVSVQKNIFLDYQLGIAVPDVNLEIRYAFRPIGYHFYDAYPNVHAMSAVSSVATNNQDEEMVLKVFDEETAGKVYNADWAAIVDFVPKFQFSELPKGRMLALYAEGKGSVFVFFLYDEPSQFLEEQVANLRFRD